MVWVLTNNKYRNVRCRREGTRAAQAPAPIIHPSPAPTTDVAPTSRHHVGAGWVGTGGGGACAALVPASIAPTNIASTLQSPQLFGRENTATINETHPFWRGDEGGASARTHHPPIPRPYNRRSPNVTSPCRGGLGWDGRWGRLRRPRSSFTLPLPSSIASTIPHSVSEL